jgi:outer membrane PBP1 activator LpoA protein
VRVSAKMRMLGAILSGLCLSALANTTNDQAKSGDTPVNQAIQTSPRPDINSPVTPPSPNDAASTANPAAAVRLTLILPLQSESLGGAANAVRAGFMAAYEQDRAGVLATVIETTDIPEEVLSSYTNALSASDIVIGPLTRSCAAAIAESGAVRVPTISLTQSDLESDTPQQMPPLMITMGLSVEDEARQVANWILSNKPSGKVFAVSTSVSWQRRAAKAFVAKMRSQGSDPVAVELGSSAGYLSAVDLANLKKQLAGEKPAAVFLALSAAQARQVREQIGNEPPVYGTSQLNPFSLPDLPIAERMPDMNGVHLLDIPWQLQADHPAVMVYPRTVVPAGEKRNPDLERLYALGIDAFRVARLVAAHRKQFELDGVTGKLSVGFNKDSAYFERIEPEAIYRDGMIASMDDGH